MKIKNHGKKKQRVRQPDNRLPHSVESAQTDSHQVGGARNYRRLRTWSGVLTLVFSFLLVGATCVYTVYSRNQWRAMETSLRETRISREVENRAYINVKSAMLEKELTVGEQPRAKIIFSNTGQTPARNTAVRAFIESRECTAPEPDLEALKLGSDLQSKGVVARDIEVVVDVSSPTILTQEIISQVNQGKIKLYVWGFIEYSDVFGNNYKTGFCGSLTPGGHFLRDV